MKMPFFVYTKKILTTYLFLFIGVRVLGRTIPLQKTKALFQFLIILSMHASESLLRGAFFSAMGLYLSALLIFKTVFGRRPVRIMYVRK
jgi:hypothetical protein